MSTMSEITQGKFKILANRRVGAGYFKMTICAPGIVQQARPGQFVHLRCQDSTRPLLRRPVSFHRLNGDNFEILYKLVGSGTNLLAKKKKGGTIDVLGPLGNGFSILDSRFSILVGGGMGIAPLLFLAEQTRIEYPASRIQVLIGAKTKAAILCAEDFKELGVQLRLATDDGSRGHKGPVMDLLKKLLRITNDESRTTIYACGPKLMLKEVGRISQSLGISAWASFEENMACGVGACLGCAIRTRRGYKRACKDGPVFNLQEISWEGGGVDDRSIN